jgi:hypothetical protein
MVFAIPTSYQNTPRPRLSTNQLVNATAESKDNLCWTRIFAAYFSEMYEIETSPDPP